MTAPVLTPPPPAPPQEQPRPAAPLRVALRAVGAGAVAALLVPGHRVGAGTVVAALAVAVAVPAGARVRSPSGRPSPPPPRPAWCWWAGCVTRAGSSVPAWSRRWPAGRCCWRTGRNWRAAGLGMLAVVRRLTAALPWVGRPLVALGGERRAAALPAVRGVAAAVVLLAVFGGLFVTADAAFRELLGRLALPAPGPSLPLGVLAGVAAAALVGAATLVLVLPAEQGAPESRTLRPLRPVEWVLPLVVLDLLFAAFVAAQLTVLFGGRDHVLATSGLTYAEYARQGFGQLVVTALLTLAVVAVCVRVVPRSPGSDRVLQVLLGLLCLLTLVVLASASRRLGLYEQEYGFTRLRVSVDAAIGWIAAVLLLVLVAGALRRADWLPRAVVLSASTGLLLFAAADPEARIAERNVARYDATGDLDAVYLQTLSADAVPALQALLPAVRPCLAVGDDPLAGWNLSRARATELACR